MNETVQKMKKITTLSLLDFDRLSQKDIDSGKDFLITNYKTLDKIKKNDNDTTDGSIFSRKYGFITPDDDESFKNHYSCDCGNIKGTLYEGNICPKCGTEVIYRPENIDITGWLRINKFTIIHPMLYNMISSIIKNSVFMEILSPPELNIHGIPIESTSKNKYANIGMIEFEKNFDEILDYYMSKWYKNKPDKDAEYEFIKKNRDKIFIHNIPVYSLILRPVYASDKEYKYTEPNAYYTKMMLLVKSINDILVPEMETNKILHTLLELQNTMMLLVDYISKLIGQTKKSFIRSNLLGAKFNYVARNVIVPNTKATRIDEVELSYMCFLELFKPEIINILHNVLQYDINVATNIVAQASLEFNDLVYNIMLDMVNNKEKPVKILINRNPTLHFYSIMFCRVSNVVKDYNDKTLTLNLNILAPLNADFDGDVLNIISAKDAEIIKALEIFNPVSILIDRTTGEFNSSMNLMKDQIICLNMFGKLGYDK